jgi:hypothetical protein
LTNDKHSNLIERLGEGSQNMRTRWRPGATCSRFRAQELTDTGEVLALLLKCGQPGLVHEIFEFSGHQ